MASQQFYLLVIIAIIWTAAAIPYNTTLPNNPPHPAQKTISPLPPPPLSIQKRYIHPLKPIKYTRTVRTPRNGPQTLKYIYTDISIDAKDNDNHRSENINNINNKVMIKRLISNSQFQIISRHSTLPYPEVGV